MHYRLTGRKNCLREPEDRVYLGENSRLRRDLSRIDIHLMNVETSMNHPNAWKVCGGDVYFWYGVWKAPLKYL